MNHELISTATNFFRHYYEMISQFKKEDFYYSSEVFDNFINHIKQDFKIDEINEVDLNEIKRIIEAEYQIYQPDGIALIDDYEHNENWYSYLNSKAQVNKYWNRYRAYLMNSGWSISVLNKLNTNLNKLMNYLGDPYSESEFARRGLIMGDVQSGKTSNYIGLICKAADAGYKVVILLTGTTESLRKQTQIRVEEGFIGYEPIEKQMVGVGLLANQAETPIPKSETTRKNDFTGKSGNNSLLQFDNDNGTFIFITKKNSKTLEKIRLAITNINIRNSKKRIDESLLIIDDEADNASVNTKADDSDPTKINKEIRLLLKLFTKSNYVGYTATPFANVFIDPDSETDMLNSDLFPENFIYCILPPNIYIGAKTMFIDNKYNIVQIIDDHNDEFPVKHNKDWKGNTLFPSLVEAINAFFIINAIRDIREKPNNNSHRSMMINVSRFINTQIIIKEIVENRVDNIINSIKLTQNLSFDEYIKNQNIKLLYDCYNKHYRGKVNWNELFKQLYNSIKCIKIFRVPLSKRKPGELTLDYENYKDEGLRAIVIGGLALSRGLTLDGLTISYLYRSTKTFDVLMQMGRWFGYRNKPVDYADLCKVWMLSNSKRYFEDITKSIETLKEDISRMVDSKRTPRDFGIRVRNESEELGITSRNKMRNTAPYVYLKTFYGKVLETPFVDSNISIIKHNIDATLIFLDTLNLLLQQNSLVAKNIRTSNVTNYISKLKIHDANESNYFQKRTILQFIERNKYEYFDVAVVSGSGNIINISSNEIKSIERGFDMVDVDTIRISGSHRRLGGRMDTKLGLSKEQIDAVEATSEKTSSVSYLIENRIPILLLYFVSLNEPKKDEIQFFYDECCAIYEEIKSSKNYLIGIGLGFPKTDNFDKSIEEMFIVNKKTRYDQLMLEMDNEEDE